MDLQIVDRGLARLRLEECERLVCVVEHVTKDIEALPPVEYAAILAEIRNITAEVWYEVEAGFLPERNKYT